MISDDELSSLLGDVLRERGRVTVPAAGFSMGNAFREADALVIERIQSLRPGDVVVFCRFDRWVAHRVLHVYGETSPWLCLTRGDAVLRPDHPVRKGEAVGVVTALMNGERCDPVPREPPNALTAWVCRLLARTSGGRHPAPARPA